MDLKHYSRPQLNAMVLDWNMYSAEERIEIQDELDYRNASEENEDNS